MQAKSTGAMRRVGESSCPEARLLGGGGDGKPANFSATKIAANRRAPRAGKHV